MLPKDLSYRPGPKILPRDLLETLTASGARSLGTLQNPWHLYLCLGVIHVLGLALSAGNCIKILQMPCIKGPCNEDVTGALTYIDVLV